MKVLHFVDERLFNVPHDQVAVVTSCDQYVREEGIGAGDFVRNQNALL